MASTPAVTLAAHYEYDPYGSVIVANDVDATDMRIFLGCLSGPGLMADPRCAE